MLPEPPLPPLPPHAANAKHTTAAAPLTIFAIELSTPLLPCCSSFPMFAIRVHER
jgi:hypothetical protein